MQKRAIWLGAGGPAPWTERGRPSAPQPPSHPPPVPRGGRRRCIASRQAQEYFAAIARRVPGGTKRVEVCAACVPTLPKPPLHTSPPAPEGGASCMPKPLALHPPRETGQQLQRHSPGQGESDVHQWSGVEWTKPLLGNTGGGWGGWDSPADPAVPPPLPTHPAAHAPRPGHRGTGGRGGGGARCPASEFIYHHITGHGKRGVNAVHQNHRKAEGVLAFMSTAHVRSF